MSKKRKKPSLFSPSETPADEPTPSPAPTPASSGPRTRPRAIPGGPHLSDLSVTEFLTLARMGFLPRGLVIGVSIYDAGKPTSTLGALSVTQEMYEIGNAMTRVRRLAVNRLRAQAKALQAEGVVGVRLTVEHHQWHGGHSVARVVAVGTAIGFDATHAPPEFANSPSLRLRNEPFTSDLSGSDFVTLLRAGYRPVSIALGNCVYELAKSPLNLMWMQGNQEITEYTQALMNARETAMQNLERTLENELSGDDRPVGVVGMTVTETTHAGRRNVIEYTAVGTAIAPLARHDPRRAPTMPAPTVVVPLDR